MRTVTAVDGGHAQDHVAVHTGRARLRARRHHGAAREAELQPRRLCGHRLRPRHDQDRRGIGMDRDVHAGDVGVTCTGARGAGRAGNAAAACAAAPGGSRAAAPTGSRRRAGAAAATTSARAGRRAARAGRRAAGARRRSAAARGTATGARAGRACRAASRAGPPVLLPTRACRRPRRSPASRHRRHPSRSAAIMSVPITTARNRTFILGPPPFRAYRSLMSTLWPTILLK